MHIQKPVLTLLVLVAIVGSIIFIESRRVEQVGEAGNQDVVLMDKSMRVAGKEQMYDVAKEISTPDTFINVDDITISELVGEKVILVDFWTYSCINCQRTLPYLNSWHEKYADDGLVILGIHTPEFEFEKDLSNVQRAVDKFSIEYPVILDNDFSTWRSYENRYWPRKYLIDIDGFIVYDHIGEGAYEETEEEIVRLLNERKTVLGEERIARDVSAPNNVDIVDPTQRRSPEMYFGYSRLEHSANMFPVSCLDASCDFSVPETLPPDRFAISGTWRIEKENTVLEGENGSIVLHFYGNKVNIVAGAEIPVTADIYLDGEPVGKHGGEHISGDTTTFITHDLYNLVDLGGNYGEHTLEIRFRDEGVSVFTFTFG